MKIKIKAVSKINPQDLTLAPKFYAQIVPNGHSDLKRLSDLISKGSTVMRNDIYAVLIGLVEIIEDELSQGRTIDLGELGRMRLSVNSEGSVLEEDVNISKIKSTKILYRPGPDLLKKLKILEFEKIQSA